MYCTAQVAAPRRPGFQTLLGRVIVRVQRGCLAAIVLRVGCHVCRLAAWHEQRSVKGGPGMQNLRLYGQSPFTVAVLHGGPGAPGTMAPVARELATEWGVLEPLQTADSLDGQV